MWPGRARSSGLVAGSTAARTVRARSWAEMPVVTPALASIETVNAVWKRAVFSLTMSGQMELVEALAREGQADEPAAVAWP